jgi:hypothetical protein
MFVNLCCISGTGNETVRSNIENTDTIIYYQRVFASPKFKNAKAYRWKVGAETTYRTDSLLNVSFDYPFGHIDITLIVEYDVDSACHINLTGFDTIRKSIFLVDQDDMPMYGKYRGYKEESPNELIDIELGYLILFLTPPIDSSYRSTIIRGFPNENCERLGELALGSKEALIRDVYSNEFNCNGVKGMVYFTNNFNSLEIRYKEWLPNSFVHGSEKKFFANRIN